MEKINISLFEHDKELIRLIRYSSNYVKFSPEQNNEFDSKINLNSINIINPSQSNFNQENFYFNDYFIWKITYSTFRRLIDGTADYDFSLDVCSYHKETDFLKYDETLNKLLICLKLI